jgi:hypothetical protein
VDVSLEVLNSRQVVQTSYLISTTTATATIRSKPSDDVPYSLVRLQADKQNASETQHKAFKAELRQISVAEANKVPENTAVKENKLKRVSHLASSACKSPVLALPGLARCEL